MQRVKVGASFIGWDKIRSLYETAQGDTLKLLVLCLFKTGGRTSEVLGLRKNHFDFKASKYSILVRDMVVLKKFKLNRDKNGKPIKGTSQSIPTWRTFPILKDELLSNELTEMIKDNHKGLLFHYSYNRNAPLTRQLSWHRVKELGHSLDMNISDHWFRGMRASELTIDYDLNDKAIDEFFGWTSDVRAMRNRYRSYGWEGLEREMLIGRKTRKDAYKDI